MVYGLETRSVEFSLIVVLGVIKDDFWIFEFQFWEGGVDEFASDAGVVNPLPFEDFV